MDTHLDHVRQLFDRLREADLKLKESKCNFSQGPCPIFGSSYNQRKGIEPVPEKIGKYQKICPSPTTPKEVKTIPRFNWLL